MNKKKLIEALMVAEQKSPTKKIRFPQDVLAVCADIISASQEHFVLLSLDNQNRVLRKQILFIGSGNNTLVCPRVVFLEALKNEAAAIIVVHNHPSGDPTPSKEDLAVTDRLREAGKLININLVDHIVIARDGFESLVK
jgi:DNA repair protein RadC